jgi:hemerythrin-like domain-containing protein
MLLNDHNNIRKILALLNQKTDAIKHGKTIDYSILRATIDYLQNNVEKSHHFVEEHIYEYCLDLEFENKGIFAALASEHQQLEDKSEELADMVDAILANKDNQLEQLSEKLAQYIQLQQQHMSKEEQQVKPLLEANLNQNDWDEIKSQLDIEIKQDPLFAEPVAAQYQALAQQLSSL